MNEKQKLIDHFKLYADSLANLNRPLQLSEIKKFQALAAELCDLSKAEKTLANLHHKFQVLKMQQTIQQLKQKHI